MKITLIVLALLVLTMSGFLIIGGAPPHITVPPDPLWTVAGYTITNTVFSAWVAILFLVVIAVIVGPRLSLVPGGFSGFVEAILSGFYNIVVSAAGEQNARRFFPLVATIFFYILVVNWMSLLPGFKTVGLPIPDYGHQQSVIRQVETPLGSFGYVPLRPETLHRDHDQPILPPETAADLGYSAGDYEASADGRFSGNVRGVLRSVNTDITAPLAIAIVALLFIEFWGLQSLGFGYVGKFFAFSAIAKKGPLGLIDIFVGLLELVSELSRMISFTFRLFGNMFAGSVLMLMMTFLTPLVLTLPFYGLELFVGGIQAFVFAMLTLVFAVSAVSHHAEEHHVEEHSGAH